MGLDPRRMALAVHQAINGPQGGHLAAHVNQQAQVHQAERQIEAFAANPANRHFAALRMDMAKIVQSGRAQTLPQAYQIALAERQKAAARRRAGSRGVH
jgi:hypothetical protein